MVLLNSAGLQLLMLRPWGAEITGLRLHAEETCVESGIEQRFVRIMAVVDLSLNVKTIYLQTVLMT